jgi:hypothetical protein
MARRMIWAGAHMDDGTATRRQRGRPWMRLVVRILVAMLVSGVCLGGWVLYHCASVSLRAERTLQATIFTVRLVEVFVAKHKRWPRSWEELERLSVSADLPQSFRWPQDSAEVRQRVTIDFEADLREIARQDPMTFTAIRPIGPHYEYRDYGFVPSLQKTIRKSVTAASIW